MRHYIVSATAAFGSILVMAATIILPDSRARAADECHAAPKGSAPQGSHWYYRTDRATQRKCWFLGEKGAKGSPNTTRVASPMRLPPERPNRQSDATTGGEQAPKAKPNELDARAYAITPLRTETSGNATSGQAADRQDSTVGAPSTPGAAQSFGSALLERTPGLMSAAYAAEATNSSTEDEMPSVWPVLARAEAAATDEPPMSSIRLASLLVFLAGVLASAFLAVRAVLRRSTRVHVGRSRLAQYWTRSGLANHSR